MIDLPFDAPNLLAQFSFDEAREILVNSVSDMAKGAVKHLPNLVIASIVLLVTLTISKGTQFIYGRVIRERNLRQSLKDLFRKLITIAIWVSGLLVAMMIVFPSVKPESLLAGLGLSSIAIGFAFKDVVENFFAGFLILIREPLEIGDFMECEGIVGKVEEISIRDTLIRQVDGQQVVMPNAMLFKNPLKVMTDLDIRATTIVCGVAYDADVDQAREVIRKAVEAQDTVSSERGVEIFAQAFGASSIDFEVLWWTGSTPFEQRRSRDQVIAAVKRALDEAGIEIPFPQRTLWFKDPLNVVRGGEEVDA